MDNSLSLVTWRWSHPYRPPEYGRLHVLDPTKPGYTRCGCLAIPCEGLPCEDHVRGRRAARLASGPCTDRGCAEARGMLYVDDMDLLVVTG